ncbi:hypothetical protein EVAR_86198_1 [Eumeta japonica]|uniref:Uncharacterized protein n=1 Tax=Eumeta variegata TaxID=151549 RepID=A0A4C1UBH7_EUMVA|nr:hypothetical protein EVAR_86198_1 [Eumeta japonica]
MGSEVDRVVPEVVRRPAVSAAGAGVLRLKTSLSVAIDPLIVTPPHRADCRRPSEIISYFEMYVAVGLDRWINKSSVEIVQPPSRRTVGLKRRRRIIVYRHTASGLFPNGCSEGAGCHSKISIWFTDNRTKCRKRLLFETASTYWNRGRRLSFARSKRKTVTEIVDDINPREKNVKPGRGVIVVSLGTHPRSPVRSRTKPTDAVWHLGGMRPAPSGPPLPFYLPAKALAQMQTPGVHNAVFVHSARHLLFTVRDRPPARIDTALMSEIFQSLVADVGRPLRPHEDGLRVVGPLRNPDVTNYLTAAFGKLSDVPAGLRLTYKSYPRRAPGAGPAVGHSALRSGSGDSSHVINIRWAFC